MPTPGKELVPEVDLHCHLLPDWDDGPRSFEESLRMAAKAATLGIKKILVTPHVGRSFGARPEPHSGDIAAATAHLQSQITHAGISLELIPGAELTLSSVDCVARVIDEPWLAFGRTRRYLLVESPLHFWPEWADQVLFELALQDITPIIAHPERLVDIQKDLAPMRQAVSRGALLQVTARSFLSPQREMRSCCRRLLEAGLVSLVASDAHSSKHVLSREISGEISPLIGTAATEQLLVENPRAILDGGALIVPVKPDLRRKTGWAKLFARVQ